MKLLDVEPERVPTPPHPPKQDNWVNENKGYTPNDKDDPHGIGNLSDGSNLSKLVMTTKLFNFMDNTTMHGMRYIFMRNISQIRRLLWLLIVLAGMGYWYYIFTETLKSYLAYPTVTKISTVYEKKSELPAVTICNYNSISKSKITEHEQAVLARIFAFFPLPENVTLGDYDHVDVKEFFRTKGTDYRRQFCTLKGLPCNSSLFTDHVTDFGLCRTFDPGKNLKDKYQIVRGSPGGLNYGGVYPVSEWTLGPFHHSEGLIIKIHQSNFLPSTLQFDGLSLLPSLTSDVVVTRYDTTLLPAPYGECGNRPLKFYSEYSRENCLVECQTDFSVRICGCRLYFMPGTAKMCTLKEMAMCQQLLSFPPNDSYLFDASVCGCPRDCHTIRYETDLSQIKLSEGYTSMVEDLYKFKMSDGIAFRMFYKHLQYKKEVEEPVYTTEKLLCDVGGAAGLFLGCSFITIMEVMDFIVELFWFCCTKGALLRKQKSLQMDANK